MTVSSIESKTLYAGNGSTASFAIPFMFLRDDDIELVLSTARGDNALVISTDYTVSGAGDHTGGQCFLTVPPGQGEVLVIRRNPTMVQEVDYVENDAFPAATHEAALDKLTMICQALAERLDRTITFRVSSSVTGVSLPEPEPGRALAWNDAGTNLANKDVTGQGAVLLPLSVDQGGTGAATAAEALANLGFTALGAALAAADDAVQARQALGAQPADPTILTANTAATLAAGYAETPVPYAGGDIVVAAGSLRTVDTTGGVTLGPITAPEGAGGRVTLLLTGGGAVAHDAGYTHVVGEYDSTRAGCIAQAVSDGASKWLIFVNTEG
ncbi:MAG: phage tail fiber protein [Pseudomonadota bacterium]